MQYTIRGISPELDRALKERAKATGRSVNQLVLDLFWQLVATQPSSVKRRQLTDLTGSWQEDAEFDAVLAEHEQVDPEMWR